MDFFVPYKCKSIYSTRNQAEQITSIIKNYVPNNCIITDATACIGGNSVLFADHFKFVNCVEINSDTVDILKYNMNNYKNKIVYSCSYNIVKYTLRQDVVFMDPPWGGSIYKTQKKIDLLLDNINVFDIIDSIYNHCNLVAIKVPNNFNRTRISDNFWKNKIYSINKSKKCIYKLVIFYKSI